MPIYHHLVTVNTEDGAMPMYIAHPEGPGPFPAVVLISGQPGPSTPEFSGAERLAQHGYVGAVPDQFHRGPSIHSPEEERSRRYALTDPQTIADVNAAFAYLQGQSFVQKDSLAIAGFCMGGRVAYMMATLRPDLRAAADLYGGGVLTGYGGPAPFEATANIRCPLLILNGEDDRVITPDEVRQIAAELDKLGKVHEVHFYPNVGHGFISRGPKDVTEDAWERMLVWFDRYLAREPALARA